MPAVTGKIGARISAEAKKKYAEAYEHLKAATAIVETLHGGLGNDDGEESRSGGDEPSTPPAPRKERSRPAGSSAKDDLNDYLLGREIVREIATVAQRGLEDLKKRAKQ